MTFRTRRLSEEKPVHGSHMAKAVPVAMRASRGIWGWYGTWKARKQAEDHERRTVSILRRIMVILLALLLALVLLAGVLKALVSLKILTPERFLQVAGADLATDSNGQTNFLLLGVGDEDHDGVDLTDTMMIASIDPKQTKSAVLLSIPRDLYTIDTLRLSQGRINGLYRDYKIYLERKEKLSDKDASEKAMRELAAELSRKLGMQIHYILKVDFTAFTRAVDALGGVDINVPEDLVDTEYPRTEPQVGYETFIMRKGLQHMDGETALKYARSRHSTSDFDRSERQQMLVQALALKASQSGIATSPGKISSLLKILSENVETTMSFGELLGAGKLAEQIDRQNLVSMHLTDGGVDQNGLPLPGSFLYTPPRADFGGASVLLPNTVTGRVGNWGQIKTFAQLIFGSRSQYVQPTQIHILNAGARSGLARMLGFELSRYGFHVTDIENMGASAKDESAKRASSQVVASIETDAAAADFFGKMLGFPSIATPTPDLPTEKLGQITIILGKDYAYKPLQLLLGVTDDSAALRSTTPSATASGTKTSATGALSSAILSSASQVSSFAASSVGNMSPSSEDASSLAAFSSSLP